MELIKPGNSVLVLWKDNNGIEKLVEQIKAISGNVAVENVHRLSFSGHSPSSFDIVISNFTTCPTSNHSSDILDLILTLLKPNGILVLREAVTDASALSSTLKISGFIVVDEPKIVELAESDRYNLKAALDKDNVMLYELTCQKPNFEVGSAVKLSFANKAKVAAIWKLGDDDTEDEDIIDSENLLDEDDFAKPDPASLRVCGTTGKRKACKDCSCGLAEELQAEGAPKTTANSTQKSSCGSCYLGDAFRCASCPYLGMPAFKPGEKIQLSDNQLKADT